VLSRVRVKGRRLRFRLSEAAKVAVTLKRRRTVRRLRSHHAAGARTMRLPRLRGRVRVLVRATDAAGYVSRAVRLTVRHGFEPAS